MKKLFALLLLIVVTATSAMAALEFSITPGEQDIAVGGSLTATLTATNNGAPVSNLPVQIKPGYSSDLLITIDPTTNALGQATISSQR
jgi:uncharacterized GH25 family protein